MAIFIYPPGANVVISTSPSSPLDVQLSNGTTSYDTVASTQLPTTLGAKTGANSLSIVPASDSDFASETTLSALNAKVTAVDTGAVVVATSALPTGAATEATLATIAAKTIDTSAVTVTSSALPTGAATEATLATLNGKVTACNTGAVTVSSSALPTGAATETTLATVATEATLATLSGKITAVDTGAVVVSSSALPSGAATEAKQDSIISAIQAGQVAKTALAKATIDYSSTNVTSAAYVELIASVGSTSVTEVEIFDSSGQALVLATGAASSEVEKVYITPGGNGRIPLSIASGTRVAIKALSDSATAGLILVNFYG